MADEGAEGDIEGYEFWEKVIGRWGIWEGVLGIVSRGHYDFVEIHVIGL